jgi:hypothetical protein
MDLILISGIAGLALLVLVCLLAWWSSVRASRCGHAPGRKSLPGIAPFAHGVGRARARVECVPRVVGLRPRKPRHQTEGVRYGFFKDF